MMQDPAPQHRAANRAGRLAAQGLIDGPAVLAEIIAAARQAAPAIDAGGLAMRLHHRFADARDDTSRHRAAARGRIAAELAPLLDRRAPGATLLAAAHAADPADVLLARERIALVEQQILRRLRSVR